MRDEKKLKCIHGTLQSSAGCGMKKFVNLAGRDGIGLIHYSVPRTLVKRNRLKILWVHRILTTSKH